MIHSAEQAIVHRREAAVVAPDHLVVHVVKLGGEVPPAPPTSVPPRRRQLDAGVHEYRIQDAVQPARRDGAPVKPEAVGEEGVEPPGDCPLEPVEGEAGRGVANEAVVMYPVHPPSPPAVEEEAVEEVVVAIEE